MVPKANPATGKMVARPSPAQGPLDNKIQQPRKTGNEPRAGHTIAPPDTAITDGPAEHLIAKACDRGNNSHRQKIGTHHAQHDTDTDGADELSHAARRKSYWCEGQDRGGSRSKQRNDQAADGLSDCGCHFMTLGAKLVELIRDNDGIVDQKPKGHDQAGNRHLM